MIERAPLDVWVPGDPAEQGNHRVGRGGRIYDSSRGLDVWRETVATMTRVAWRVHKPARHAAAPSSTYFPAGAGLVVTVAFAIRRPRTVTRPTPAIRPDIDKLVRAILDGLQQGGAYPDDGAVLDLHASKRYHDSSILSRGPGAAITVEAVT